MVVVDSRIGSSAAFSGVLLHLFFELSIINRLHSTIGNEQVAFLSSFILFIPASEVAHLVRLFVGGEQHLLSFCPAMISSHLAYNHKSRFIYFVEILSRAESL